MSCYNAGGFALPTLVIFNKKTVKLKLTEGKVHGTMYGFIDFRLHCR